MPTELRLPAGVEPQERWWTWRDMQVHLDQLEASSDDERAVLTSQRDKLEAERLQLVQAHYADAIPRDLLKTEQDRISTSLDAITHRLDSLATTYQSAHEGARSDRRCPHRPR